MKEITMKDVPPHVWDAVYEKWTNALRDGWSGRLWNGCDLCEYVFGYSTFRKAARYIGLTSGADICPTCPLWLWAWCRDSPHGSRLHINCGRISSDPLPMGEEAWKGRVKAFLKLIEPFTSGGKQ